MFGFKLIPEFRGMFWRLWSIRVALFWGAVCGLYAAWPAFQDVLPAPIFAALSVVMSMAIVGARILKQPGTDE
ncbi:MAG: hypothetical protein JWM36_4324 [Hyphomicrobiales bacterium]|nr:hypothetical protein [Hyphomicrobiales bacterium]